MEHLSENEFKRILEVSKFIYDIAEIGSQEFKSSKILMEYLESIGFSVKPHYLGMETAFRAEFGEGGTTIAFLAEYDALPNGHSCGHNLISAWAIGCATALKDSSNNIRVVVIGTPSEEGIGEYAGSKAIMAQKGAFNDIDIVFGFHPDDRWGVGSTALADLTIRIEFHGKSAHGADSPELGINALDAAVSAYAGINNLRGWAKNSRHLVVGMVFRESGRATNVIPDLAVLDVEIRSTSTEFARSFEQKVRTLVAGIAEGYGATVSISQVTPLYESYKHNREIDRLIFEELSKKNISASNADDDAEIPSGSTDEANVSQVVPTGHLDMKIGYTGIAGHSDDFRAAVDPYVCSSDLGTAIDATVNAALRAADGKILKKIKEEFRRG